MEKSGQHSSQQHATQGPPPLPPRADAGPLSPSSEPPPPYSELDALNSPYASNHLTSHDPRSSSQQSLVPDGNPDDKRRLLLIYVHGFMGDETSFQSFPAHVHNLLTVTLADERVVHTKIYPKYRSRRSIEEAAEAFSKWLTPHETPDTDVVLVGHSMGGLLASEVTLLPPYSPATGRTFRHRVLGTLNFDTPFLGMHPGVVGSGLSSIFRPADPPGQKPGETSASPNSPGQPPSRINTLFSLPSDPNYNPSFENDVRLPVRKGLESAMHFFNKHSDGLIKASRQYVKSHIEFGGAMADYPSLKRRYYRIRALEEQDEKVRKSANASPRACPRIRFLNYYTASTGRPKRPKSPSPSSHRSRPSTPLEHEMQDMTLSAKGSAKGSKSPSLVVPSRSPSRSPSPRISLEEHRAEGDIVQKVLEEPLSSPENETEMEQVAPIAEEDTPPESPKEEASQEPTDTSAEPTSAPLTEASTQQPQPPSPAAITKAPTLPEIPPIPQVPAFVDISQYPDKETRKLAEKEHSRQLKAYKQAVKDRNTATKDREKLQQRQAKNKRKEEEKHLKDTQKANAQQLKLDTKYHDKEIKDFQQANPESVAGTSVPNSSATSAALSPVSNLQQTGSGTPNRNANVFDLTKAEFAHIPSSAASTKAPSTMSATTTVTTASSTHPHHPDHLEKEKKKRDKKFCVLPPKDVNGNRDPTWVRVFMEGVDEVGAHCGLFFLSETYEKLVGDVSERIEGWVRELETDRLVREYGSAAQAQLSGFDYPPEKA